MNLDKQQKFLEAETAKIQDSLNNSRLIGFYQLIPSLNLSREAKDKLSSACEEDLGIANYDKQNNRDA